MKIRLAYQLYSARDDVQADLYKTLKAVKEIGYEGVEFAGLYDHPAKEVRAMLDEIGLTAVSGHISLDLIRGNMFEMISDYKTLGCPWLALSHLDPVNRPGGIGFPYALQTLYRFGYLCRQAGIQFLYHNHGFELDTEISGMNGLDFLLRAVPRELMKAELDTGWILESGCDPAAYIRKYDQDCPVVHLKDYVGSRKAEDNDPFHYCAVGHGKQDLASVLSAGLISGTEWFVVEQDFSDENTPLEDAALSCEAVRKVPLFKLMGSAVRLS